MPWLTIYPVLIWAAVAIPLTVYLWLKHPTSKLNAVLLWLNYSLFNLAAFYTINWAMVNYFLRFTIPILILLLFIRTQVKTRREVFLRTKSAPAMLLLAGNLLVLAVLGYLNVQVLQSFNYKGYPQKPVLMMFPLRNGMYTIANGGNNIYGMGMNNHARGWFSAETKSDPSMAFGIDVVKMNASGTIGKGVLPPKYTDYLGFMDIVYTPCFGEVVYVEDGHPEVQPFGKGTGLGNYLVLQCAEYYITLGNLRRGSIIVKVGDSVRLGMQLATVGSTADPAFVYLHVHATTGSWKPGEGTPVPMLFDGSFSVNLFAKRNSLLIPQ